MNRADVSVIIPVFNEEQYLRFAIESVLAQSLPPREIIVIDDGSTDRSGEIAREYPDAVLYHYKKHSGPARAKNVGIGRARGRFIAFLDADDLWVEHKLELQLASINASGVDMVFGYMKQFISPELQVEEKQSISVSEPVIAGYSTDTLFIAKETLLRVGLFSPHHQIGEFIEWYSRAKDIGLNALVLPQVLALRRIHRTNLTRGATNNGKGYVQIIKSILDRRRLQKKQK